MNTLSHRLINRLAGPLMKPFAFGKKASNDWAALSAWGGTATNKTNGSSTRFCRAASAQFNLLTMFLLGTRSRSGGRSAQTLPAAKLVSASYFMTQK